MTQEEEDNTPYWLRINQHIVGAKEEEIEEDDSNKWKREKREEKE